MKVTFAALTVVAAGLLLLAASCQQANKGESKSKWQLKSPPGTAAGYGTPPVETEARKENSTVSPTGGGYGHGEATPATSGPAPQQSATEGDRPGPSIPALKIEPPPSAAGYGRPPLDADAQKETPSGATAGTDSHGEAIVTTSEQAPRQPATENDGPGPPTSSWKIVPPPSAAGYGK